MPGITDEDIDRDKRVGTRDLLPKPKDLVDAYNNFYATLPKEDRLEPDEALERYVDDMMDSPIVKNAIKFIGSELEIKAGMGSTIFRVFLEDLPQFYRGASPEEQKYFDDTVKKWQTYNYEQHPRTLSRDDLLWRAKILMKFLVFYFVNIADGYGARVEDWPRKFYVEFYFDKDAK